MKKILCQYTALTLVLVLLFSMVPQAFAVETETPAVTEETAGTMEETVPDTAAAVGEDPPPEDDPNAGIAMASANDGIMPISGSQASGVKLLNLASPYNYTCSLSSQVYVKYVPAGSSSAKTAGLQNLGWHYYSYNGVQDKDKTIYCIQPHLDFNQGSSGNYVDQGVDVWGSNSTGSVGSNAWYALSGAQRNAIGYILLYSDQLWDDSYSVLNYSKNNNPNYSLRIATQILIYEVVTGLRDASSFNRLSSNGYTSGSTLYDAFKDAVPDFRTYYNSIVSSVQAAETLPSFARSSSSSAQTITVEGDLTWVTDTNGVSDQFTFVEDNNDIWFSPYANEVAFQNPYGFTGTKLYSCYKNAPSASASTFSVFYSPSTSWQTCVSLYSAKTSKITGYFKVSVPAKTGDLSVTKITSDGQNLSGWQFAVYSNSACTSLVAGPSTTNSSGKVSFTGLNAGTYYIKETGHTNSATAAKYNCSSTNPRSVTISAGSTSSVSFTNTLKPGSLTITKSTSDGKNLQGWQFSVYSNSACTSLISGPHTTGSSGTVTVSNLSAGTVYVKEVGHQTSSINSQYTCSSTNPQSVAITAGGTSSVSFTNTLKPGSLTITKTTSDSKNLSGWQFSLYSNSACTTLISGPHTTGSSGSVTVSNLTGGQTVYVKEVGHNDASIAAQYSCSSTNPQSVAITAGGTATVSFRNELVSGDIKLVKNTNTGENRSGWQIGIYTDTNCTKPITGSPFVTGTDGTITVSVAPGTYYGKEEPKNDPYWQCDTAVKTITVSAGQTATASFQNTQLGYVVFQKTTNTGEDTSGWEITIYSDEACTTPVKTVTTLEDGKTGVYIAPGTYFAKESGDSQDRFADAYWQVDATVQEFEVKPNEETSVTFQNIHCGDIQIIKTVEPEGSLDGWLFKVTDSTGAEIEGSPFISSGTGEAVTGLLLPGTYTVEEQIPEGSLYQCLSTNPQTIAVKAGQTGKVYFTNTLRPGTVTIYKVDTNNEPLADAKFKLEWSVDGDIWTSVTYSDTSYVVQGGCGNPDIENGCLLSGEDGIVEWTNLHPGVLYRVMEQEAPSGYILLTEPAFQGELPEDDLTVTLRVVNGEGFTMPDTGSREALSMAILLVLSLTIFTAAVVAIRRKRVW